MSSKRTSTTAPTAAMSGIIRLKKERGYASISNDLLRDERLSFAARGVLAYLLSHTDNWTIRMSDLIRQSPAARDAVQTIIKELRKFGYVRSERLRKTDGTFNCVWTIYEVPLLAVEQETPAELENPNVSPHTGFPYAVEPDTVEPSVDEPDTENTVITKDCSDVKLTDVKPNNLKLHTPTNRAVRGATTGEQECVCVSKATPKSADAVAEARADALVKTESTDNIVQMESTSNGNKGEAAGLRGLSLFTFDECLAYTEHLHKTGQGVTAPVGLAKKVHRTGSDDRFIAAFLESQKQKEIERSPSNIDVSQCPDCNGKTMFYPDGYENGVARCKHPKLRSEANAA